METRNWSAWIDLMPPGPRRLHVEGEVQVGNPGVQPGLTVRVPKGINPRILLMDLQIPKSGKPSDVMTWVKVRYSSVVAPASQAPAQVEIFYEGQSIATQEVKEVH